MSRSQRTKGQSGEREVAMALGPVWPEARRGLQAQGGERSATCDVEGTPLWLEVKRYAKRVPWDAAMRQAQSETDGRPVVVVGRTDRGKWRVMMELSDFVSLMEDSDE